MNNVKNHSAVILFKPLLFACLLTMTVSSCMLKPDMEDNATPASLVEVQKSLATSWGKADPLSMNPNDFIYLETDQRLEQQEPKVVMQEGITVSKKEEATNEYNYTFLYQTALISGEQIQQSTKEDHRCVAKNADGCATALVQSAASVPIAMKSLKKMQEAAVKVSATDSQLTLGFEKFIGLAYACQTTPALVKYCQEQLDADTCEVSCANLKSFNEQTEAPPLIKAQTNCGGFPDCKINLNRVSFDWSFKLTKGQATQTQKINYSIALSPDMPFLSRVMEYCSRGLINVPQLGTKVLVSICNRVKNYVPSH